MSDYAPALSCFASRDGTDHTIRINLDRFAIIIAVANDTASDEQGRVVMHGGGSREHRDHNSLLIRVASSYLHEALKMAQSMPGARSVLLAGPRFRQEPVIERLARALISTDADMDNLSSIYVDSVSRAIVTRVVKLSARQLSASAPRPVCALPKWRLQRVVEFVEANLSETIGLSELAKAAGLSRMHFAAQFRAVTGMRPHDYVIQQRIHHARQMLQHTQQSIVEIALSVGFQTQAHFTTVFRRIVGETPERWRRANVPVVRSKYKSCLATGGADGVFN